MSTNIETAAAREYKNAQNKTTGVPRMPTEKQEKSHYLKVSNHHLKQARMHHKLGAAHEGQFRASDEHFHRDMMDHHYEQRDHHGETAIQAHAKANGFRTGVHPSLQAKVKKTNDKVLEASRKALHSKIPT